MPSMKILLILGLLVSSVAVAQIPAPLPPIIPMPVGPCGQVFCPLPPLPGPLPVPVPSPPAPAPAPQPAPAQGN